MMKKMMMVMMMATEQSANSVDQVNETHWDL